MGFRIHRGIFQKLEDDGRTYTNAFKVGEDGRIKEVDADGNPIGDYLKVGETATNADTVDGYHATNAAGGIPVLNGSNAYWYAPSWIHLNEGRGIFSGANGAHLLPNNQGQYGAWRMIGTRNGWEGLHFGGANGVTLMMNETESGLHRNGVGWKYRHQGGKFYVYTGTNGGGTGYEVYHKGNLTPIPYNTGSFVVGGDAETYYPVIIRKSSRTTGKITFYRDNVHQDENSRGSGRLVLSGFTSGWGHVPLTLHYETKGAGGTLWKFIGGNYRTNYMVVYLKGATTYYYKEEHGFEVNNHNPNGEPLSDGRTTWNPVHSSESFPTWEGEGPSINTIDGGTLYHDADIKAKYFKGDGRYITNVDAQTLDGIDSSGFLRSTAKAADSNLLDGIDSSQFLRSDANDTHSGQLALTSITAAAGTIANTKGSYLHIGAWGTGRTAADAVLVNTAYRADYATNLFNENISRFTNDANYLTQEALTDVEEGLRAEINTAQTTADSKLGSTEKAADSEAVDGIDSSRIVYGVNARRSTRYDGVGMVSPNQNSGFYYGYHPDGAPYAEWWNWLTVAGASWTSGNNYDFKLAHNFHADDFYVSRMHNGTQHSWRKVWDSGNFNPDNKSDVGHSHNDVHAAHGYINSGDWNTLGSTHSSDTTMGGGIYRVESSTANPPASGVYNWSLYQQGNTSRGSQIAVGAYAGGNRLYFRGSNQTSNVYRDWAEVWHTDNFDPSTKEAAGAADAVRTELDPRITANSTDIARNATDIATKAAAGGSYGQDFTADDMYVDQWFRNTASGKGLYNQATTQHWYSDGDDYWNIAGGGSFNAIRFRDEHGGTQRGLVGADNNSRIGFLDAGGSWAVRHDNDSGTLFYTDGQTLEFRVGRDKVTGNYGTVQVDTNRNGWGGYSIYGQYVLMSNGSRVGIYNDIDNEWMLQCHRNAQTELYHNGSKKLETTSSGATVTGTMTATAFSGDGSALTGISAGAPPVEAFVEGGEPSTLVSITFSPGEGVATFTLADGSSYRLAFAR